MNDCWFTVQQLVGISGMPKTTDGVRFKANNEKWERRKKTKGKGFEYNINSLPEETKTALILNDSRVGKDATLVSAPEKPSPSEQTQPVSETSFNYDREALWNYYDRKSNKLKNEARKRLDAINTALSLIQSDYGYIKSWKLAAEKHNVHYYTLRYRWYDAVKRYIRCDWVAVLVPGYIGRTVTAECDEQAWSFFKADYLRLEQPTLNSCYRRLESAAKEHNWTIPSAETLARRIKREIPMQRRVIQREGEQALYQLYPPQKRSVRDMHAMHSVNGDGYQHNVFVLWPDGTIARPKTWFWQDIYSRKLLSYRVDTTENTDTIRLSFGDLVEQFGIPKHITIDNTRAAANKWMTGGKANRYRFKVKEDDPHGLFTTLVGQENIHWTSVFNGSGSGQSKPVERPFGVGGIGEVVDKHPEFSGCYTGKNPMAKPENYGSNAVPLEKFIQILEQGVIAFNAQLKRRTEMAGGIHSFDFVFNQSYQHAPITKATEEQRRMWLLSAESVKVTKQGTVSLSAGSAVGVGRNRYRSDALYNFAEEKVVVRFDPQSLHKEVFIYDLKGTYIDKASCIEDAGFHDTQAAREHNRARKEMIKSVKKAAKAETRMTAIEVSGFLPQLDKPLTPDAKVVRQFRPVTERKANNKTVVSIQEREQLAEEMKSQPSNVIETPRQKYFRWVEISGQEDRTPEQQQFYETYQKTAEFAAEKDICEEFGLIADRADSQ